MSFRRVLRGRSRRHLLFERAEGGTGLADYSMRNRVEWHHHSTRATLAARPLDQEARRGKAPDCAPMPPRLRLPIAVVIEADLDANLPAKLGRRGTRRLRRNGRAGV